MNRIRLLLFFSPFISIACGTVTDDRVDALVGFYSCQNGVDKLSSSYPAAYTYTLKLENDGSFEADSYSGTYISTNDTISFSVDVNPCGFSTEPDGSEKEYVYELDDRHDLFLLNYQKGVDPLSLPTMSAPVMHLNYQ